MSSRGGLTPAIILGKIINPSKKRVFSIEDMPINGQHLSAILASNIARSAKRIDFEENSERISEYFNGSKIVLSITDYSNRNDVKNIKYYQDLPSFLLLTEVLTHISLTSLSGVDENKSLYEEEKLGPASDQILKHFPGVSDVWRFLSVKLLALKMGPSIAIDMAVGRAKKLSNGQRVKDGGTLMSLSIIAPVSVTAATFLGARFFLQAAVTEALRESTAVALLENSG